MIAYQMVSTFPNGNQIKSALFRWRSSASLLANDKTISLMHEIVGAAHKIEPVKVSFWKWLSL